MGCGASSAVDVADHHQKPQPRPQMVGGSVKVAVKPMPTNRQPLEPIKSSNSNSDTKGEVTPAYTAFEIKLNDNNARGLNANIDSLLSRPIAGRNTTLEPLAPRSIPVNAEFDDPEIERKRKLKQKQLSRRRTELMSARRRAQATVDYDDEEEEINVREEPAVAAEILESKMTNAERMREMRLQEIQEKQRLREERARLARERAQSMKRNGESEMNDIEAHELGRRSTMTRRDDDDYGKFQHHRSESPPTPTPHNTRHLPPVHSKVKSPRDVSPDSSSGYNTREVSASSQANTASVDIRTGLHPSNQQRQRHETHSPRHAGDEGQHHHNKTNSKIQARDWDDEEDDSYEVSRLRVETDHHRIAARDNDDDEFY